MDERETGMERPGRAAMTAASSPTPSTRSGYRPDDDDHLRRSGGGIHRCRPFRRRVRRHPCRSPRHTVPGARADPPRDTAALRWLRQRRRARPQPAPRPWLAISVRRLPGRTALSRHREFARLRPRARRQGLCRTLHPQAEGKSTVDQDLPDDRGAASRPARIPRDLQHQLADRTAWLHHPGRRSTTPASVRRARRVGFNPVSHNPRAVHDLPISTAPGTSSTAAALIGWQVSPFQFEVGMADLAIGATACGARQAGLMGSTSSGPCICWPASPSYDFRLGFSAW